MRFWSDPAYATQDQTENQKKISRSTTKEEQKSDEEQKKIHAAGRKIKKPSARKYRVKKRDVFDIFS